MDEFSKVDWPGIIREVVNGGPLGILALVILVAAVVLVVLFAKEADARYRIFAFIVLLLALIGAVILVFFFRGGGDDGPAAHWKVTAECSFEKEMSEGRKAVFQLGKFPLDSKLESSLSLSVTLQLASMSYAPPEPSMPPCGYGFIRGVVMFGSHVSQTPGNGGISLPGPSDANGCQVPDQEIELIRARGRAGIEAFFKSWHDESDSVHFTIANGPRAGLKTDISLDELVPMLQKYGCPQEVKDLIAGLSK